MGIANRSFQTHVHAKCILAGEHTVLYGYPALVAPVLGKMIMLSYVDDGMPARIEVEPGETSSELLQLFFWDTMRYLLAQYGKTLHDVRGKFHFSNSIAMGAGLGFSAALCVALTRWIVWNHWLKSKKVTHFARYLEGLFHGKSSGLDIAGVMSHDLVHFNKLSDMHKVAHLWKPNLYLSYSGVGKDTKSAISKVVRFRKKNAMLARELDAQMRTSVTMLEQALLLNQQDGLDKVVEAINLARACFQAWGLITPELQAYMDKLQTMGAIAIKPTGAGGGGYVLSLWSSPPVSTKDDEFIPIF